MNTLRRHSPNDTQCQTFSWALARSTNMLEMFWPAASANSTLKPGARQPVRNPAPGHRRTTD
eukprot:6318526-Lingulodinium_polyedra.AAC.1